MESTSNRYKPYSRPSVPRHQRQTQRQRQDEQLNNIPKVITRFMKKSLSWLGIINGQSDEESDTEENEAGQPSGTSNLPTATASTAQSSETIKTIYPSSQLKDHVGQSRSPAQNHLNGPFNKGSQSEANRGQRRSGLLGSLTSTGETGDMVEVQDFDVQLALPIDDSKEVESACSVPSNESQETAKENQTITLPRVEKREHHSDEEFTSDELSLMERLRKITSEHMEMTKGPRKSHDVSKIFKSSLPILIPAAAAAVYKYTHQDDDDDDDDAPMQTPRSSGVSSFVKKELKRARKQIAARQDSTDMDMDSQDSGLDADESEHGWGNSTGRSRLANRSRREIPNGSPERKRRTIRMDYEADNRSHGKEPLPKTQEVPRRHARFIPGRFSALDTDEEEEDLRRMDLEREQRDSERQHSSAVMVSKETMTDDYLLGSDFTGFSVPPHGRKAIWHDPKVDEALKWTRSPDSTLLISETWLCEKCGFRTNVVASRCEFCLLPKSGARPSGLTPASKQTDQETQASISTSTASVITAASAVISPPKIDLSTPSVLKTALADAPAITTKSTEIEVPKPAAPSGWAASGFKAPDNSSKWKCPTCDVMNDNKDDICPCCETGKPGAKKAAAPPALPSIFGAPPAMALSTPEKKPEMPSLFGAPKADAPALFGAPKTDATALFGAPKTGAPALFGAAKGDAPVPLFGASTASASTVNSTMDKSDANKPAAPAAFNFSGAGFKPADTSSKWKCPTCDVMNNDKDDKCPCCETDKPGTAKKVAATLALPPLFGGPTFGSVSSEVEKKEAPKMPSLFQGAPAAASVAESKPAAPAAFNFASAGFKPADSSNKWKCPTCDVMNNDKDDKCPCCETEKPGAAKAGKPALALPSLFGGAPVAPSSAPASKPLFGAASADNSAPSLFGASASSATGTSLFGAKVPASPSSSLFGGSSAPSTPKLQFGTPAASAGPTTSSAVAPVVSASTAPSLFGASAPAAGAAGAAMSSPATASLFGATSSTMSAPTSTSLFGTPSATAPKPLFSAPSSSALTPTSTPLFGASTLAVTSAPASTSLFGSSTTATSAPTTSPSLFGSVTAVTTPATSAAAPLFGSTTSTSTPGSAAPSLFGATTSTPAASAPATTSLFGATPAASSAPSLFGTPASKAPTTTPLFGASTSSPANPFAAATSAPASTGATSANPPLFTFGAPSTSAPAPSSTSGTATSTAPMSLFGSSTSSTTPAPAFGSTPSFTFGQPTSKNETPSFSFGGSSTASGMGTGSTAPAFGGFGGSTPSSTSGTGFTFGANPTSAPPAGAPSFSFGGSSTAPVTFGANSGNTPSLFGSTGPAFGSSTSSSGGFGQSLTTGSGMNSTGAGSGAQNSMMMSPMMSSSTPTGSGFGGFGSAGGVGPSVPAFGGAPGAPQASPFGQPSSGNSPGMFGFGSAGGSGGPGFGGFGASNAPATGPSSGGFGQPAFGSQQQPAPGFGGFGAGAPPGAPPGAGGESLGGNFSFNIGSAPQADFPAGRKIAKMRKTTKKKP